VLSHDLSAHGGTGMSGSSSAAAAGASADSVPALTRRGLPGQSAFFASVTVAPDRTLDVAFQALTDVPVGTAPGPGVVCYDSYLTRSLIHVRHERRGESL
jgi:hypothetical protein